jgi:hypothetical protein
MISEDRQFRNNSQTQERRQKPTNELIEKNSHGNLNNVVLAQPAGEVMHLKIQSLKKRRSCLRFSSRFTKELTNSPVP